MTSILRLPPVCKVVQKVYKSCILKIAILSKPCNTNAHNEDMQWLSACDPADDICIGVYRGGQEPYNLCIEDLIDLG